MIPKKPAPDVIRGGHRLSEKIMLSACSRANGSDLDSERIELGKNSAVIQRAKFQWGQRFGMETL
jgi:hypothetical protein